MQVNQVRPHFSVVFDLWAFFLFLLILMLKLVFIVLAAESFSVSVL